MSDGVTLINLLGFNERQWLIAQKFYGYSSDYSGPIPEIETDKYARMFGMRNFEDAINIRKHWECHFPNPPSSKPLLINYE